MILVFLIFSFKLAFSLCFFSLIKRLFSSSSLSAIRVVSSAYLKLVMFLPLTLIPLITVKNRVFKFFLNYLRKPYVHLTVMSLWSWTVNLLQMLLLKFIKFRWLSLKLNRVYQWPEMTTVSVQLWHHNHTSNSNSVLSCQIFSEILSFEDFGVDGLQLGRRIYIARVWVSKSFVVALVDHFICQVTCWRISCTDPQMEK